MDEIVYSWNFDPLEVVYNEEALANVVSAVHWQYTATYMSGSVSLHDRNIGVVGLETPTIESFVPFESLTKEIVSGWVTAKLGQEILDTMTAQLSGSINNQLFPSKGILSPPWN